jgi:CO/xanthine dehydrogenase FAD-binding subunit
MMIPIDFSYCRPDTLEEAAQTHAQLLKDGFSPVFYGGGSEIITMSRSGSISPGAVIDIKSIPECNVMEMDKEYLAIGAANSLYRIKESKLFEPLGTTCGRISDHTNQCRITLGGNLCGTIQYRECCLALMLCETRLVLCGPRGIRTAAMKDVFDGRMRLGESEFIVQAHIPASVLQTKYFHIKKTAQEKLDYPLLSILALIQDGKLRVAISGICKFPFCSEQLDQVLNNRSDPISNRVQAIPSLLPGVVKTDSEASANFRTFVLKKTLCNLLKEFEHGSV